MNFYYLGAAGLLVALLFFVLVPVLLLRHSKINRSNEVSNPEIVKQRLSELDSEKREALLSEKDFNDAVVETKLHLAEELAADNLGGTTKKASTVSVAIIAMAIFAAAGFVYYQVNHLDQVANWEQAQAQLPEMGQRIVVNADNSVSREELMNFALALRTKLSVQKDDAVGWLLLGRVLSTLRDFDGAILAFNKSLEIEPERVGAMFSLAQTLLVTESEANVKRAQQLLLGLQQLTPQDNSVLGLLAVSHTRLGDNQKAIESWQLLKNRLSPNDPMMATVTQQLAMLSPEGDVSETSQVGTEIAITVNLASELATRLPETGYLFVFVQDADSGMKMPAAVKKQTLSTLDLSKGITVTLSNADSMLQEFNLSNIANGRLIARISSDENVALQDGDLQGELVVPVVQGEKAEHQLLINKEI